MAIIEIREYAFVANDGRGRAAPLPAEPPIKVQRLDNALGAVVSAPFDQATTIITISQNPKADTRFSVAPEGQLADPDPVEPSGDETRGLILAEDLPHSMGVPAGGRIAVL